MTETELSEILTRIDRQRPELIQASSTHWLFAYSLFVSFHRDDYAGDIALLVGVKGTVCFNFHIDFLWVARRDVPVGIDVSVQRFISLSQTVITAPVINRQRSAGAFFLSTGRHAVTLKFVTGNFPFISPSSGYSQNSGHSRLIGMPLRISSS